MKMNKMAFSKGIGMYIKDSMVPQIPDTTSRRIMAGVGEVICMKPDIIDRFLAKYHILEMLEEEGEYDIDAMETVLRKNIQEYGNITVDFMGAKFTFTDRDLSDVMRIMVNM